MDKCTINDEQRRETDGKLMSTNACELWLLAYLINEPKLELDSSLPDRRFVALRMEDGYWARLYGRATTLN